MMDVESQVHKYFVDDMAWFLYESDERKEMDLLKDAPTGTFYIRPTYTAYKEGFDLFVKNGCVVTKVPILVIDCVRKRNGHRFFLQIEQQRFSCLKNLVDHYIDHPLPCDVKLVCEWSDTE
jgi:hypothetical protein